MAVLVTGMAGVFAFGGCSSSSDAGFANASVPGDSTPAGSFATSGSSSGSSAGPVLGGNGQGHAPVSLPPEMKAENRFLAPVATGNVVWIANPASGRVAYIDAATFAVQTIQAGTGPTYLAAVPDATDDVIVLNVMSQDATLLRRGAAGITTTTFPSTADANSWAISASGRWAIAWTDATQVTNADPTQSFQEVAVLDLTGQKAPTILTVGYRPSQFAFSGDDHAFAVTQ
ncbi:MAG: YncE family protein, partial [Polyangiaceae bacterium]